MDNDKKASKKSKKEESKEAEEVELTSKLNRWWNTDRDFRQQIEWRWFQYDLWNDGYHWARYNKNTKQIETTPKQSGKPLVTINKIAPTVRAVVNYALRNRPKAEVTPADGDGVREEVVDQNRFLDFMHDQLGLRSIQRGAVEEATVSGISWVQVLWDEDANEGKGDIVVNDLDKYDCYWDATARSTEEMRRFTIVTKRKINDLKEDSKYKGTNWDLIKSDNKMSSSSLRERLLQLDVGQNTYFSNKSDKDDTVLVREHWWIEEENNQKKVYVCAVASESNKIIRPKEETDLDRLPFFRLCTQKKKNQIVGKSWIKDLIPLNRRLNHLMSSLAEYNVIMNKVFWIADKGAGVRTITNDHGIIVYKKRGYNLQQNPIAPLSAALYQEINQLLQLFEDIGAIHEATMGRIPTGAKSGKALEALQVGDSNNLAEVVENTEQWLEEIYEYILTLAAQKYQFARDIQPVRKTQQRDFIKVIGEEAQAIPEGATILKKKNIVDVKISSYLAHTPEARREAIRELASIIPDLDEQTILEVYEVGPIADIVERIKKRREEKMQDQRRTMEMEQEVQAPPALGGREAIAAIRSIINNQQPQPPARVSPEYIGQIDSFLQTPEAQQLPPDVLNNIQSFRDALAQTLGVGA
jgi:hypothetical protein